MSDLITLKKKLIKSAWRKLDQILEEYKEYPYYEEVSQKKFKLKKDTKDKILKLLEEYENDFEKQKCFQQELIEILEQIPQQVFNIFQIYVDRLRNIDFSTEIEFVKKFTNLI